MEEGKKYEADWPSYDDLLNPCKIILEKRDGLLCLTLGQYKICWNENTGEQQHKIIGPRRWS